MIFMVNVEMVMEAANTADLAFKLCKILSEECVTWEQTDKPQEATLIEIEGGGVRSVTPKGNVVVLDYDFPEDVVTVWREGDE